MNTITKYQDVKTTIVKALESRIQAEVMFTAFDITQEVRGYHKNENIPHDNVKGYINSCLPYFQKLNYNRTSVVLDNGDRAYVYHPTKSDPQKYRTVKGAFLPPESIIDGEVIDD